jgi:hypothetical protein
MSGAMWSTLFAPRSPQIQQVSHSANTEAASLRHACVPRMSLTASGTSASV